MLYRGCTICFLLRHFVSNLKVYNPQPIPKIAYLLLLIFLFCVLQKSRFCSHVTKRGCPLLSMALTLFSCTHFYLMYPLHPTKEAEHIKFILHISVIPNISQPKYLKVLTFSVTIPSKIIFAVISSTPANAITSVSFEEMFKLYFLKIWLNLCTASCNLSSYSALIIWIQLITI